MSNGCPVCLGLGRVVIVAATPEPIAVACPECAGLAITPASAEDPPRPKMRLEQVRPALPAPRDPQEVLRTSTSSRNRP